MPRDPKTPIKTPGVQSEAVPDDGLGESDADKLAASAADLDDGEPAAGAVTPESPSVTLTVAELQAMISAEVNKVVAAQRPASAPIPEPELPHQDQIDPNTITRPTLSKQGYVVPKSYGEPDGNGVKRA